MSKYNNMKSIPIDSLNDEELKIAIKEWAEGDDSMEKLLWTCRLKNVETMGCHAGAYPYIEICVNNSKEEAIRLMSVTYKHEESQILILTDGGNPFSGPKWCTPCISLSIKTNYKDEADIYFNELSNSLLDEKKESTEDSDPLSQIIDLYNFFIGKESCIVFRLNHLEQDNYIFKAEVAKREKEFDYFNDLFTKAGFVFDDKYEIANRNRWKIESDDKNEFERVVKNAIQYIIGNYSLGLPTNESEVESFHALALFKKREFGDTEEGIKQFNDWLAIKKEERNNK